MPNRPAPAPAAAGWTAAGHRASTPAGAAAAARRAGIAGPIPVEGPAGARIVYGAGMAAAALDAIAADAR